MITRAQVADLQPGDVVEFGGHPDLYGATVHGPLYEKPGGLLLLAGYVIRDAGGEPSRFCRDDLTLTVVSRAPRPLYVNHPRTEPVPGDVVRDADSNSNSNRHTWVKNVRGFSHEWLALPGHVYVPRDELPARLRLLVNGETGQVVP